MSNTKMSAKIEPSWKKVLGDEFEQPYMVELKSFLQSEMKKGKTIYPRPTEWFNAFNYTPFDDVKVVLLGQDPYHGPGQAHGLSFSVRPGVRPPPSLINIFKEMQSDLGLPKPDHGFLEPWAERGVLLLNAVLTVEQGKAGAHQNRGWERFTDRAIQELNARREGVVFLLWGAYAQKKGSIIDTKKHAVFHSHHPSPLSASRGFFGSKPFSKSNNALKKFGLEPIDWKLPSLAELRQSPQWAPQTKEAEVATHGARA